jgi:hypothetical protein
VRLALQLNGLVSQQPEIGFVHQCCALQGVVTPALSRRVPTSPMRLVSERPGLSPKRAPILQWRSLASPQRPLLRRAPR